MARDKMKRNARLSRSRYRRVLLASTALCAVHLIIPQRVQALPQNGTVVEGVAQIVVKSPTEIQITQSSAKVVIDWQSFNIAANEKVVFIQLDQLAQALNRVIGPGASQILGQLSANGAVILSNPNGILFGAGSNVNVQAIIATTANITNQNFMAGNLKFDIPSTSATASVINRGTITAAQAGLVGLVAPGVENSGLISARLGSVQMVSGNTFTLDLYGDKLIKVAVSDKVMSRVTGIDGQPLAALVGNSGRIEADGGTVILTANAARDLVSTVINMDGVVRARSVASANGRIVLDGGDAGMTQIAGKLDASGANTGETGGSVTVKSDVVMHIGTISADGQEGGGTVNLSGRTIYNQGNVTADSAQGAGGAVSVASSQFYVDVEGSVTSANGATHGGRVTIDGAGGSLFASGRHEAKGGTGTGGTVDMLAKSITLVGGGIDASGGSGGGAARIGGDFHGAGDVHAASTTLISPSTTIDVSARNQGQGGTAVVWSEDMTVFAGAILANGAGGGAGGKVEVSSRNDLTYAGTVQAANLLLDPKNIIISTTSGVFPYFQLVNPTPSSGSSFGKNVTVLSGGNVVVTSPFDDAVATDAGAVYLYNGTTGALVSTLTGTTASDQVGSNGVTALTNGNYVVRSQNWDNGAIANAGAVTWGSGTTGVVGAVTEANSLVGTTASDQVGSSSVTALTNGNYVVVSTLWDNGAAGNAGAVTWGSGTTGVVGAVTAANSLVGTTASDSVGSDGVTALTNGNYVVASTLWGNGAVVNAGAVTWGSGTTGVVGAVTAANSLVGIKASDSVGNGGVTALTNGNYVVSSHYWDNGAVINAGAATWGSGTSGVVGAVTAANSLVGTRTADLVGSGGVTALTNGNYVVRSFNWDNGVVSNVGAVTWGSGTSGVAGVVTAANSLVGNTYNDYVGSGGVTALTNGNYVVLSKNWRNGAAATAGAVTWGSGTTGVVGAVTAANSLVGTTANSEVGSGGVTALTNGNYVVRSQNWRNGTVVNAGAVTWGSGTTGVAGAVTAANSLVGTKASDNVGSGGVTALTNGNYVVSSQSWDNGAVTNVGAVTWGSGTSGVVGAVTAANSLVGTTDNDLVGNAVTALTNGNYVVSSSGWRNGATVTAGAVTWGSGTTGVVGAVTEANSLVGTTASDNVGSGGVTALANGNYVVRSPNWNNGAAAYAGAVTWGSGTTGVVGAVTTANSLVGTKGSDNVGNGGVTALSNGNYVVRSNGWDNGAVANAGAVTWGSGTSGVVGAVTTANSLVGSAASAGTSSYVVENSTNGTFIAGYSSDGAGKAYVGLPDASLFTFAMGAGQDIGILPSFLTATLNTGTAVTLQANNDITVSSAITASNAGQGGALTLQAGRSILINADITTDNGNLTLVANETAANGVVDAYRDAGAANITMASGTTLNAGTGNIQVLIRDGAGNTNRTSGDITLDTLSAGNVLVQNNGTTMGSDILRAQSTSMITATSAAFDIANAANTSGTIGTSGSGLRVTLSNVEARTQGGDIVLTSPNQGVNIGGDALGTLTGVNAGSGAFSLTTAGAVTQTEAISAGSATFSSGGSPVTLASTGNSFGAGGVRVNGVDPTAPPAPAPAVGGDGVTRVIGGQVAQVVINTRNLTELRGLPQSGANNPAQASFGSSPGLGIHSYTADIFNSDFKIVSVPPNVPGASAVNTSPWGQGSGGTTGRGGEASAQTSQPQGFGQEQEQKGRGAGRLF